jgi:S-formylglutathione hydrolase FrmB
LFDALHGLAGRAPDVLLTDGGNHSYWHDRSDGKWGTSVLREAIPAALLRSHANPNRVAIGGISMGGFGALDIARLDPRRFCAIGAHSAALWFHGADTPAGAFDDAQDFSRHDLLAFARERAL